MYEFSAHNLSCIRQQKKIFSAISFTLNPGELLVIQGANGCGKSSLLRILSGLCTPSSGSIHWLNNDIKKIATLFSQNMHYIGHQNGHKTGLSVQENLNLQATLQQQTHINISDTLQKLNLIERQNDFLTQLSAGQKRRVALARLWLIEKKLWLLDEPNTALDVETQTIFYTHLQTHLQQGGLVIMTSHHEVRLNYPIKYLKL